MAGSILEHRLSAIASRLHRLRVLRRQTACWLLVMIPAITLCLLLPASGLPLRRESLSLIVACTLGLVLARWKLTVPSWLETARLVEQHNPGLNDVLLTAVRRRSNDSHLSSVLVSRVLKEADEIALVADWKSVASGPQIFKWFAASLLTFAVLVSSVVAAARLLPFTPADNALGVQKSAINEETTTVTVEPGDAEVERGTGLTVVARFTGRLPSHAAVQFRPVETRDATARDDDSPAHAASAHSMSLTVDAGVFMVRLPAVTRDGSYVVVYGDDESSFSDRQQASDSYHVTTFVRPRVVQVDASITPPAWTGRDPSTVEDTLRIVAIEGSAVTLQLHLNKPMAVSHLKSKNDTDVPLTAVSAEGMALQATVTASENTTWTVFLQDAQGRSARDETQITLRIIHNQPPIIRIAFPQPDISVSALQEVITEAEVTDDFGIVDYGITFSLSGGDPQTLSLALNTDKSTTTAAMTSVVDLESLGAEPNDLLTWHFYADAYAAAGQIQRSLSDLMFADVRRFEEIFRESLQQGGQGQPSQSGGPTDDLLQTQRQIAIAIWNIQRSLTGSGGNPGTTIAKDVNTIRQSQEVALVQLSAIRTAAEADTEISDAIEAANDHMTDVVDALTDWSWETPEPAITDASSAAQTAFRQLLRLRAAEHDVQRSQSQRGQGSGQQNSAMQQQLDQLELDNDRNRYETEQQAQQDLQTEEQREQLQVLNRLKELARRQNMLNERLKQLESELRIAESEEERERIERELKRLRDEQQELLRDVDELGERMDQSPSRNNPQQRQLREEVDQARENVRKASRAMDDGKLSEALSEGTRAERQFDQLQEEFRNQTSSAFTEAARDLRQQAQELTERQQKIAEQLPGGKQDIASKESQDGPPSLRIKQPDDRIEQQLGQQRDDLKHIVEQSKELIKQSEVSQPLLARRLYEAVKQVEDMRTEDALRAAEFLAGRGLWPQVAAPEQAARRGIEKLQEGIEEAATAVLGGEVESLRRAQQTLEQLSEELSEELSEATGRKSTDESDPRQAGQGSTSGKGTLPQEAGQQDDARQDGARQNNGGPPNEEVQPNQNPAESRSDNPGQTASSKSDQESQQSSQSQQPGNQQSDRRGQTDSQSGQQSSEAQSDQPSYSILQGGGRESGGTSSGNRRPLTGSEFRDWSDRLRDVEEMLNDTGLRQRVARVRDRARSMRAEFRRHGTEPQWDLVESGLLDEMQSLQRRLVQDIAALKSDRSMVPIDREPVPEEFDELVQRYYELLGQERNEAAP